MPVSRLARGAPNAICAVGYNSRELGNEDVAERLGLEAGAERGQDMLYSEYIMIDAAG